MTSPYGITSVYINITKILSSEVTLEIHSFLTKKRLKRTRDFFFNRIIKLSNFVQLYTTSNCQTTLPQLHAIEREFTRTTTKTTT